MREIAYAKINLALHVRARQPDGYHRIETVFAFAEEGDRLTAEKSDRLSLEVTGPFARQLEGGNLALAAAEALRERYGVKEGARLLLEKCLPVAAGLGGGSADAAAALRLLNRLWEIGAGQEELLELARTLGSDVPACVLSRAARGEGRGDDLRPLDLALAGAPVLLANPCLPLSTASVFRAWDGTDRGPLGDWTEGRNDLEPPARSIVPEIGDVLEALGACGGARLARMSGSGATCFALFGRTEERDRAACRIAAAHPGWWLLPTRLR